MTGYRHKMPNNYIARAIYLLYGLFFPSDTDDSADNYSAIPRIPCGWPMLSSKGTHKDKGPVGSGRSSFAL